MPEALRRADAVHAVARRAGDDPCSWHEADLLDADQTTALIETVRPTHLLHLAWIATPGVYWTSPDNERWAAASLHLARTFARCGGRHLVVAGTCAEYDWGAGTCDEAETPLKPATPYGKSKLALCDALRAMSQEGGFGLAWARLFFLYGPNENPARLVPSVIGSLLRGEEARCSAGSQRRDFLQVQDAAAALVGLLLSEARGVFNVASGSAVPVRDVAMRIGSLMGATDRIRFGDPSSEPPLLVADTRRLRSALRWEPRLGLSEGLEHAIDWWRKRLDLPDPARRHAVSLDPKQGSGGIRP